MCFFRDLWQLGGGKGQPHSPKRTFDLCLFSERQIIIIEAKAQQGFDKDQSQLKAFAEDKLKVAELTGVDSVLLVGLASSQHISSSSTRNVAQYFDGRLMSWKEMADHYLDEPETTSLIRADAIHSKDAGGKNNEGKLCGDVRFGEAEPVVEAITPVPGGVGTVTTSVLVSHVVEAAEKSV